VSLALPGVDPDGNPIIFRIVTLPAAGSLFQYSGGIRGSPITATNTLLSDSNGRVILAPGPGETGNPYGTFNFMVENGIYTSGLAPVTVNILWPAAPLFTDLQWDSGGSGGLRLNFVGDSNATYSVWAGTNLVNWDRIGTASEPSAGQYQFIDAAAANWLKRFYRISAGQ
jgi:hypothetical protein